jgi:hypothetical protein
LSHFLLARLRVLDDEHHPKVTAATSVWKIVSSRFGNPTTMLMTTQTASAPTIDSATAGWERQLSRACNTRLSERRSGFRYCSVRIRTFSPKSPPAVAEGL